MGPCGIWEAREGPFTAKKGPLFDENALYVSIFGFFSAEYLAKKSQGLVHINLGTLITDSFAARRPFQQTRSKTASTTLRLLNALNSEDRGLKVRLPLRR